MLEHASSPRAREPSVGVGGAEAPHAEAKSTKVHPRHVASGVTLGRAYQLAADNGVLGAKTGAVVVAQ